MAREKPDDSVFRTRVNGLEHCQYHKHTKELELGRVLRLTPDPSNTYDSNAIKVCLGEAHIGWIPRTCNHHVLGLMTKGPMYAFVYSHDMHEPLGGLKSDRMWISLQYGDPGENPFDDEMPDTVRPEPKTQLIAEFVQGVEQYSLPVNFKVRSDPLRTSADLYAPNGDKIGWFRKNTVSAYMASLIERRQAYAVLTGTQPITFELRDARIVPSAQPGPSPFWSVPPDAIGAPSKALSAALLMADEIAHSRLVVKTAITQNTNQIKEPIMSKFDSLIASNKNAATIAATMEAGRIANNQVAKLAAKKLPMIIRGYADTPMGKLVIANLAQQAALHFRPGEQTLAKLTEAMQVQAFQELMQTVDLEGFIDNLMDSPDIKRAIRKLEPEAYASEEVGAPKTTRARK